MKFSYAFNVGAIILVFTIVVLIGLPSASKPPTSTGPVVGSFKWDCNGNSNSGVVSGQMNLPINSYGEFTIADCSQSGCYVSLGEFKNGPLNGVKIGMQSAFKYRSSQEVELNQLAVNATKGLEWVADFGLNAPGVVASNTLGEPATPFHLRLSVAVPGLTVEPEGYTPPFTEVWCTFKFYAPSTALNAIGSTQGASSL